jgi:hypothetical protein
MRVQGRVLPARIAPWNEGRARPVVRPAVLPLAGRVRPLGNACPCKAGPVVPLAVRVPPRGTRSRSNGRRLAVAMGRRPRDRSPHRSLRTSVRKLKAWVWKLKAWVRKLKAWVRRLKAWVRRLKAWVRRLKAWVRRLKAWVRKLGSSGWKLEPRLPYLPCGRGGASFESSGSPTGFSWLRSGTFGAMGGPWSGGAAVALAASTGLSGRIRTPRRRVEDPARSGRGHEGRDPPHDPPGHGRSLRGPGPSDPSWARAWRPWTAPLPSRLHRDRRSLDPRAAPTEPGGARCTRAALARAGTFVRPAATPQAAQRRSLETPRRCPVAP